MATRVSRGVAEIRISRFMVCGAAAPPGSWGGRVAEEAASDDHALHLAGALADLADLGVAHHALDGVLRRIAPCAKQLDGARARAHGELAGIELRDGGRATERLVVLLQPGSVVDEVAGGFDLRRHVGERELDALEVPYRVTELPAAAREGEYRIEAALGEAERERADADPPG